jgi:hypothetical protein
MGGVVRWYAATGAASIASATSTVLVLVSIIREVGARP